MLVCIFKDISSQKKKLKGFQVNKRSAATLILHFPSLIF